MQAREVLQDAIKKPSAVPKAAQCHPLTFTYDASPSGVDSNLLILLHGLGDTHIPFQSLGKKLASNLPQTAVLSLRAGCPVPFMEGASWAWWDVWDSMGQGERKGKNYFDQCLTCMLGEHRYHRAQSIAVLGFFQKPHQVLD
jgi:predicted esterase